MPGTIVAMLSDVGHQDDAVALCKGLVLGICPDAVLVDVTHDVTPYDVEMGASYLGDIPEWFPAGTVVAAYVYPETGTSTRTVAVRNDRDQVFVVPDNGLLTLAAQASPVVEAYEVSNPDVLRTPVTATWYGRDVVTACAAHLAAGVPLSAVGPRLRPENLARLPLRRPIVMDGSISGRVVRIDAAFGNVWTDITTSMIDDAIPADGELEVRIKDRTHRLPLRRTFGDVAEGAALAYVNSRGQLAFGVNRGNFAAALEVGRGCPVDVRVPVAAPSASLDGHR